MANPSSQSPIRVVGDATTPGDALVVAGDVADNAVDSGNPVKIGGNYSSTLPTYADGDRADFHSDSRGNVRVTLAGFNSGNPLTAQIATDGGNGSTVLPATPYLWNGATFDRERGNTEGTALASAARTALTNSADIINYNARGVYVWLDITADPSSAIITCHIQSKDVISGTYTDILTGATQNAVSFTSMTVYPGITTAANLLVNNILPRTWRIAMTVNDSDSMTYSVGYSLIL